MSSPSAAKTWGTAGRRLRIDSRRRWLPDLGALLRARQLVALLSRRDITVRYRQTVLGAVWLLVGPLISAGLFTFVFGRVADLPSGGVPYFAFSYAGLLGWNLFSSALLGASTSLTSNSGLIMKIFFPRLVLPLSTVASPLINTAVSFVVMLALLVLYNIAFTLRLLLLPFWLLLAIVLAMGVGLVLASSAVFYRDVTYMTQIFVPLFLYLTPVAYSLEAVPPELRGIYQLNPVATVVEGCRWSLLGQSSLSPWAIVYTVAFSIVALILGLVCFARLEWHFADVI
jgi:lipopolysaccharide transport system permease protein